jgi:hypothetical protein|tara:strand:- start:2 stop:298 length:297 start_codon:yes stop_codon:yes gene_type:complete
MSIKRYSFSTKEIAQELILKLAHEKNELAFDKITTTESTYGIVCLGFQDVYEYDQETETSVLIKKGLTYDVDIFWKDEENSEWLNYEVNPVTPNHKFA